jgi:hypothetical protein
MAIHKHNWVHDNVSIITGSGRKAPSITVLFRCSKCKGTRTKDLKARVPSNTALTDEQIWDREAERKMRERDSRNGKWNPEGLFEKEWIEKEKKDVELTSSTKKLFASWGRDLGREFERDIEMD